MSEQLVCTTDYKKKRGKLYFIDLDGYLCEGVMCGLIGRDEKGKPIYASPDKVLELDIQKEINTQLIRHYEVDLNELMENMHSDFSFGNVMNTDRETSTKITSVLFLNDDYDGGEIQVWYDKIESKTGRIVMFPSFAPHRPCNFSKSDRYTLITLVDGKLLR